MRAVLALIAALLTVPAVVRAENKPNPVCLNRAEFIEYGRRNTSEAVFRMLYDPDQATSFTRQLAPIFDKTEADEKKAASGDLETQYALGENWGECMLDGFEYVPEKREKIVSYIRASNDAGRKRGKRLLGFFEALGWAGSPPSALRAFPYLSQTGVIPPADDAAAVEPVRDSEKARRVIAATIQRVLPERLDAADGNFVIDKRGRHEYPLVVMFSPCDRSVRIDGASRYVRMKPLTSLLDAVSSMLPSDDLDCTSQRDSVFSVEITLRDTSP